MYQILVVLLFLGIGACSATLPSAISNPFDTATKWSTQSGVPTKGNSVDFTQSGPPFLNYLTKKVQGLKPSVLSVSYTITTTGNPVFDYRTKADNTCGKGSPGTIRLFFQRYGDNMSGDGPWQQYRYWSVNAYNTLGPGSNTLSENLADSSKWQDVYGEKGSAHQAEFEAALAYAENVGVTFGGGCFFGHGVKVVGGNATFTVNSISQ